FSIFGVYLVAKHWWSFDMTADQWLQCNSINRMFQAIVTATHRQLTSFTVSCCRRIWERIYDEESRRAIEALESSPDGATIPHKIARAANRVFATSDYVNPQSAIYDPARSFNAAQAVAHAVRHSLPKDDFHYGPN